MHSAGDAALKTVQSESARKNEAEAAGSSRGIADLYAIYSRRLYKTIVAITRNPDDAEDALQETFLRIYLAFNTFEGRSNIYSWLTRIAINSALLVLRRRRVRREILFDPQLDAPAETIFFEFKDSAPNPEQTYDQHQRRLNIQRAVRALNAQLRRPIQMRMATGLSIKEIGQVLNISEAAVKTRLHRARLRLSDTCGSTNRLQRDGKSASHRKEGTHGLAF